MSDKTKLSETCYPQGLRLEETRFSLVTHLEELKFHCAKLSSLSFALPDRHSQVLFVWFNNVTITTSQCYFQLLSKMFPVDVETICTSEELLHGIPKVSLNNYSWKLKLTADEKDHCCYLMEKAVMHLCYLQANETIISERSLVEEKHNCAFLFKFVEWSYEEHKTVNQASINSDEDKWNGKWVDYAA